jgi:cytidine deaminase
MKKTISKVQLKKLLSKAKSVLNNSYSPYSNCKVASAVLCDSGKIYVGINVENCSYGVTLCAERVAISSAVTNGDTGIKALLVLTDLIIPWSPCGICRQTISEFGKPSLPVFIANLDGINRIEKIDKLLPDVLMPKHILQRTK